MNLNDWIIIFLYTWLKKYHLGMRNAHSYQKSVRYFLKITDWNPVFLKYIKVYIKLVRTKAPYYSNTIKFEHYHVGYGQILAGKLVCI